MIMQMSTREDVCDTSRSANESSLGPPRRGANSVHRVPSKWTIVHSLTLSLLLGFSLNSSLKLVQAELLEDVIKLHEAANFEPLRLTNQGQKAPDPLLADASYPFYVTLKDMKEALASTVVAIGAKGPPVYLSAPKQVVVIEPDVHLERNGRPVDLRAVGSYAKNRGKLRKKTGRRVIKVKKVRKSFAIKYPRMRKMIHLRPKEAKFASPPEGSKYFEYRSVPSKGGWKFGYRRGNKKHAIERKEVGKKSKFKAIVEWTDKRGKGVHVFDYNHVSTKEL